MQLSYSKYSPVIVVGTRTHCWYFVVVPLHCTNCREVDCCIFVLMCRRPTQIMKQKTYRNKLTYPIFVWLKMCGLCWSRSIGCHLGSRLCCHWYISDSDSILLGVILHPLSSCFNVCIVTFFYRIRKVDGEILCVIRHYV